MAMYRGRKSGPSSSRQHASRPEAMSMDFVIRPQSKVDPEAVRARAKQMVQDQRRAKVGSSFNTKTISDGKPMFYWAYCVLKLYIV